MQLWWCALYQDCVRVTLPGLKRFGLFADGASGACRTGSGSSVSLGYKSAGLKITESDTVMLEYTGELRGGVACHCLTLIEVEVKVGSCTDIYIISRHSAVHHGGSTRILRQNWCILLSVSLTFRNRASYMYDTHTATLQTPHFIYFFNKYKYWIF
jgi:hypothetical protein